MRGSRYVARVRGLGEPQWVGVAVVAFIAVTVWWLTVDTRVPDFDSGQHLIDIFTVRAEILSGNLTAPFSDWNNYPPLAHIVGAIGTLIGGFNPASVVMANNLFFLPLLAFGCYGAGTIAGGRRAGLLAALFALGTPIVVSEMREIYLDVDEAAMVAVSVWAILATRRFERIWISALAGLVCSIGMLSKQTFAVFIVGLIAAVIVRGGWRHWRGIAMFILGGAGLTLPWYIYHFTQLHGLTSGATAGGNAGAGANVANGITPPRWSQQNFGWYVWNMLNHQLLVPLALFLVVGVVLALWRFARHRDPDDVLPELIAGGFFGYLAMTYVTLKDPRYTIPALVYMAVLGTSWIPRAAPRLRPWLTGAFGVVVLANFVAVSFGFGPNLTITFPGAPNPSTAGHASSPSTRPSAGSAAARSTKATSSDSSRACGGWASPSSWSTAAARSPLTSTMPGSPPSRSPPASRCRRSRTSRPWVRPPRSCAGCRWEPHTLRRASGSTTAPACTSRSATR